jgi:hypothetical protein
MKTQGTLNTTLVDVFLRFLMNICVSYADKLSNGYGHWKTAQDNFFLTKSGNRLSFRGWKKSRFENGTNIIDSMKGECFAIIPDRMARGSWSEEYWSCGVCLTVTTSAKQKLVQTGIKVWKIPDEECSLGIYSGLGRLIS